jgi:superoxide oxidase
MDPQPFPVDRRRYPAFLRHTHWLTAFLVLLAYLTIYARDWLERGTPERMLVGQLHVLAGLLILLLTVPRILMRLQQVPPPIMPPMPVAQRLAAGLAHVVLFIFLAVQPMLGLCIQMVSGKGISFPLTSLKIPGLSHPAPELAKAFARLHEAVGELALYVLAAHLLAALWHWRIRQDDALQRML